MIRNRPASPPAEPPMIAAQSVPGGGEGGAFTMEYTCTCLTVAAARAGMPRMAVTSATEDIWVRMIVAAASDCPSVSAVIVVVILTEADSATESQASGASLTSSQIILARPARRTASKSETSPSRRFSTTVVYLVAIAPPLAMGGAPTGRPWRMRRRLAHAPTHVGQCPHTCW